MMANNFNLLRSLDLLHLFVYMLASNGISTWSMKFHVLNVMPSENFWDEIFSSENVLKKMFHTNYSELKLMRMKIKQITVWSFQPWFT